MAEYTFDPEVFAFMFDITDVAPAIKYVRVDEVYKTAAPGQHIPITIYVVNNSTTPGRAFLMNPTTGPSIIIYGPSDTIVQAETAMEQVETGIFTYVYDTTETAITGSYSGMFKAANSAKEMVSNKYHLFSVR